MGIRKAISDALVGWLNSERGEAIETSVSSWLAKQPGMDNIEMPMRCPACSYEWTAKADLTKANLQDSIRQLLRCPICGAETSRIRK